MQKVRDRLIVALDLPGWGEAKPLVRSLGDEVLWYKVGLQLFTSEGPDVVRALLGMGKRVFLDLKIHDIPNTVGKAVESAVELGAGLVTLHAAAGREALERAAHAVRGAGGGTRLLGVTVLTSSGGMEPQELGSEVLARTEVSLSAGLDGVVAPAATLETLRKRFPGIRVLCPGIRPAGGETHDQKWVMTPGEAVGRGARWIVVGRPVVEARRPEEAATDILREMTGALQERPTEPLL